MRWLATSSKSTRNSQFTSTSSADTYVNERCRSKQRSEFRVLLQEIDGKAFMLLTSDMMMKYMGLKLGPALKLHNISAKLKSKYL